MELESLDVLIVLCVTVGILRGVTTGAVRQVVSLLGTIVAIVLGLELMGVMGSVVGGALGIADPLRPMMGFLVIFITIQIGLIFGVRLLEATLKLFKLNPLNRIAGALIGAFKALLILSVLFLALGFFEIPEEENRNASVLYEPVAALFPVTWNYIARYLPYMQDLSNEFGDEVEGVLTGYRFGGDGLLEPRAGHHHFSAAQPVPAGVARARRIRSNPPITSAPPVI